MYIIAILDSQKSDCNDQSSDINKEKVIDVFHFNMKFNNILK